MEWLKNILLASLAVLAPIKAVMIATGALIFIDLITGIWRALKAKEKITSNGLRRTITKLAAYQLTIVTGFILQTYLLPEVPMVKLITALIGVTEGKSVLENISTITGVDFSEIIMKLLHGSKEQDK